MNYYKTQGSDTMFYCTKCGSQVQEGMNYCPVCGEKITAESHGQGYYQDGMGYGFTGGAEYDAMDVENNKFLAVCSYLGALVFLPLLIRRESPFTRFHANQGLLIFLGEIICQAVSRGMHMVHDWGWPFWGFGLIGNVLDVLQLVFVVFSIWGIINVCTGKYVPLPVIGSIQILK